MCLVFFELKDVNTLVHCPRNKTRPVMRAWSCLMLVMCSGVRKPDTMSCQPLFTRLKTEYVECFVQKIIRRNMKKLFLLFAFYPKIRFFSWK